MMAKLQFWDKTLEQEYSQQAAARRTGMLRLAAIFVLLYELLLFVITFQSSQEWNTASFVEFGWTGFGTILAIIIEIAFCCWPSRFIRFVDLAVVILMLLLCVGTLLLSFQSEDRYPVVR